MKLDPFALYSTIDWLLFGPASPAGLDSRQLLESVGCYWQMLFGKKKPLPEATAFGEPTYKERVDRFWAWYAGRASDFFAVIEDGRCADLTHEVSAAVRDLGSGFAWVFERGKALGRHSFTISPEGCSHHRLLSEYWKKSAPAIEGWDFFPSRQPSPEHDRRTVLVIGEESYTPLQFWLTPEVDLEDELIHLTAWTPGFSKLNDKEGLRVLFLCLDEAIGEDQVSHRLGRVEVRQDRLGPSFPLTELPEFVRSTEVAHGWKRWAPDWVASFSFRAPSRDFPRADIIAGHTQVEDLWWKHAKSRGVNMEDPLTGTGAAYYYAQFPSRHLSKGKEVDERCNIQDAVSAALETTGSGFCIGGATGEEHSYVDVMLLDGARSIDCVVKALGKEGLPRGTTLHAFAGDSAKVVSFV